MKHKPTVTIAVSCYNEVRNIDAFLRSVLAQKAMSYRLAKIVVISDGSKDRTVQKVRQLGSDLIEVRSFRCRLGKSYRLNQLYETLETDVLIQSDADVTLGHPIVIEQMVQALYSSPWVGMSGGNPTPLPGKTLVEKAVNCSVEPYRQFRSSVRLGHNLFSSDGRLLGYKRDFIAEVRIPTDMIANDVFTYFKALSAGFEYRFVSEAVVYYRSPQTVRDQIRQNTRFCAARVRMQQYFDPDLVAQEFAIPKQMLIIAFFKQWLRQPILSSFVFILNQYCRYRARHVERHLTALWDMAQTTKELA